MTDVSSLLFVAVVVAWAAYLVPKALQHHDEAVRSRSVERFSERMRVLARREPVNRRDSRLVVQPGRGASAPVVTTKGSGPSPELLRRRESARRATQRRQRVLATLLAIQVVTLATAGAGLHSWWYALIPTVAIAAWLVMCRVMVKGERSQYGAARPVTQRPVVPPRSAPVEPAVAAADEAPTDGRGIPAVTDPALWDPVPVTLPTYVGQETAKRTVRTIDLDSTGVWSSGRSEVDSALAREAEEADRAKRDAAAERARRATGS